MDDLQLNISVSKKNNNKPNRQRVDQQSNGYKFKSKPDFSGKIFARKRHINVDRANLKYKKPEEPQNKKFKQNEPQVSNNATPAQEKKDLASKLRDLSENKGKFLNKNYQEIHDELQIKQKPKGSWISSLFKNNPEVPRVGQKAVKPVVEKVFSGTTFADLNVHPHSIANLKQNLNLTELMTVQRQSIPIILQGRDVLIRSQTGSGKTLAYALPVIEGLQAIRPKINRHDGVRVVVVVPTRELAVQTYELFVKLTKPFIWIVPGLLSGGQKRKAEKARLRKGLSILVGTPGRINDHLRHTHSLNFSKTGCLILDEADRLLDMGYEKDVAAIVKAIEDHKRAATYDPLALVKQSFNKKAEDETEENQDTEKVENEVTDVNNTEHPLTQVFMSKERQTILLSATLTKAVENLAGITMKDPVFVDTSEGKALVADSLQKEKDQMKNKNIEKPVQEVKNNKTIENKKPEVPILKKEVVTETKPNEEEQAKTESQPVIEMRGKLKAFSGSFFPELFENKEKADEPKVAKPQNEVNNAENKDDSDSDSDYEYFKVQNLNDSRVQTVTNGNKEEPEEEVIEKPNVFLQAIKSAVTEDELVLPATVNQTFLVIPMKLRLVTLCSLIIEHCILNKKGGKMIVFMATLEMVDYHSELIETVLTGKKFKKKKDSKSKEAKGKKRKAGNSDDEDGSDSDGSNSEFEVDYEIPEEGSLVPVDLDVFSLHGSMPHERRIEVFKQFRTAKRGLLICTDVAARGLDVPRVDLVLQYCAPASATDYVHRVGRTGRAAHVGAAVMFLLPSETEFVRHLEQKRIRLRQDDESKSLEALRTVAPTAATMQRAAIAVQSRLEYTAHSSKEWLARASRGRANSRTFTSWVRFYSGYPREVREMLDARKLHLGHAAKAFALRETPAALAKRARSDPKLKKDKPVNRLTVREEDEKKRPGFPKMKVSMFGGKVFNKQSSMHTASEFDSGLPPVDTYTKKKKKN